MTSPKELVFEQYYQHLRHTENVRHNFTNMFIVFIAALLAFFSQMKPERLFLLGASAVMLAVSILGFFLSWKAGDTVSAYSDTIIEMIDEWKVPNFVEKLRPRSPYISISNAYKAFYLIAAAVWLVLLIFYLVFS